MNYANIKTYSIENGTGVRVCSGGAGSWKGSGSGTCTGG